MQARYYDPVIGRFYSNDPVGFRDIHSFNRYAHVNNNPYKYVDPFGMAPNTPMGKRMRQKQCEQRWTCGGVTEYARNWFSDLTKSTQETADNAQQSITDVADAIGPDSVSAAGTVGTGLGGTGEYKISKDGSKNLALGVGANSGAGVALTANWKVFSVGNDLIKKSSPASSIHKVCVGLVLGACGTVIILDNKDVSSLTLGLGYVYGGFMTNSVVGNVNVAEGN